MNQGSDNRPSASTPPPSPSSLLLDLALQAPELLVGVIGTFLDTQSWMRLTACCSHLRQLEQQYQEHIWYHRLQRHYGYLRLVNQVEDESTHPAPTWKVLGQSLFQGWGDYYGFCLDVFTSEFEPYPMHLTIQKPRDVGAQSRIPHHTLHWRTLRDSKTRVRVEEKLHDTEGNGVWQWRFTEVEILQGSNILVPNSYAAYTLGPALVGVFPIGSFFLLRREAMSQACLERNYLLEQRGYPIVTEDLSGISPGMVWTGFVACEISQLNLTDLHRQPRPITAAMSLTLSGSDDMKSELSPWDDERKIMFAKRMPGTITFETQTGGGSGGNIVFSVVVGFYPSSSTREQGEDFLEQDPSSYNVEILLRQRQGNGTGEQVGQLNPLGDPSLSVSPLAQFVQDCTMYAWFHNGAFDCMIGLMKETLQNKTASFVLQQHQSGHYQFHMPDLARPDTTDDL
eukprot:CAMPEP_0168794116 /NCGR_PEP_ID=MMETSP0725-20121227/15455_1 /TAXON_ID=265536 /ORGANISM="Amphiprora sp., Strain CCMP467" /LENGTH=453 /DNA_ID=CAMNT_0008844953 /DNA_START=13 /DNA_END=1374 /DNA_ORIENTATION=+